jgi:predicted nucleotide-binding protein (sugar kinase/HSP70/actin superfamily)
MNFGPEKFCKLLCVCGSYLFYNTLNSLFSDNPELLQEHPQVSYFEVLKFLSTEDISAYLKLMENVHENFSVDTMDELTKKILQIHKKGIDPENMAQVHKISRLDIAYLSGLVFLTLVADSLPLEAAKEFTLATVVFCPIVAEAILMIDKALDSFKDEGAVPEDPVAFVEEFLDAEKLEAMRKQLTSYIRSNRRVQVLQKITDALKEDNWADILQEKNWVEELMRYKQN